MSETHPRVCPYIDGSLHDMITSVLVPMSLLYAVLSPLSQASAFLKYTS